VGWKTREYHGEFINIGKNGVRKTFNPSPKINGESNSIYVFGGSSIWGEGARDDHTITSCLAKNLNQHGSGIPMLNKWGRL
jgi:hypothetical protein